MAPGTFYDFFKFKWLEIRHCRYDRVVYDQDNKRYLNDMNGKKLMDRYENLGTVGEGSYGVVTKCKDKSNGLIVAIKKFLESDTDKAVKKIATREIKILKSLRHENLVNLIEVFRRNKRIYLVFEFIEHNLLEEIEKTSSGLGELKTKEVMYQVCRGLDFMHSNNVIHRDLKPENVLINKNGLIKLCDFGFARQIASSTETYTDYVATRWYRSPELLVGDPKYGKPVDVWSLGTLAYEVLTSKPLFPGESDLDQLYLIINSLGDLPDSMKLCFQQNHFYMNAKFPRMKNFNPLQNKLKKYSSNLTKFIIDALIIDPSKRSTSSDLLHHELFITNNWVDDFSCKLKNIVSIYESTISKSIAAKNKLVKKTSQQTISKTTTQKHLDKQSEINRINEINKQLEIAKLKEISKFIIQNEAVSQPVPTSISNNTNTLMSNQTSKNMIHNSVTNNNDSNHTNENDLVTFSQTNTENKSNVNNNFTDQSNYNKKKNSIADIHTTMSNAKNSSHNLNNLNAITRLPRIEQNSESTALKTYPNGSISRQTTSPTYVNIKTNETTKPFSNQEKLNHQSNSTDYPIENLKSSSVLSMGKTNNELTSDSLTNTNKLNSNLHSNSSFFGSSSVFILEETYKLNNSNINNSSFGRNTLKRQNEHKSTSRIESGINLPQVKQIELYSKNGKNSVYEKNPFLMPINKK